MAWPMLTLPKAAKASGLTYDHLRYLVNSGALRHVVLPGKAQKLIDPADLQALIESNKSGNISGNVEPLLVPYCAEIPATSKHALKSKTTTTHSAENGDKYEWYHNMRRAK